MSEIESDLPTFKNLNDLEGSKTLYLNFDPSCRSTLTLQFTNPKNVGRCKWFLIVVKPLSVCIKTRCIFVLICISLVRAWDHPTSGARGSAELEGGDDSSDADARVISERTGVEDLCTKLWTQWATLSPLSDDVQCCTPGRMWVLLNAISIKFSVTNLGRRYSNYY